MLIEKEIASHLWHIENELIASIEAIIEVFSTLNGA